MLQKVRILLFVVVVLVPLFLMTQFAFAQSSPTHHTLMAGPNTVHWGYFGSAVPPVLKINPGDTVTIDSPHGNPSVYEEGGVPPGQIPQALKDIYREVKDRMFGAILTGPIYVNGADEGDTLEVHIKDVKITLPYAYVCTLQGMGSLPEDFPYTSYRVIKLDLEKMTTEFYPGVVIPLTPFFGTMGVAPPAIMGRQAAIFPGLFGGNMDIKELKAGTILYLPIHVKGALFSIGDAHAGQGDGEVSVCAMEAEAMGTFEFFVRKNKRINWPRGETPTHFMTVGIDKDLQVASQIAIREMIKYLQEEKGIDPHNAYKILSLAADLRVACNSTNVKTVYFMLPKSIFVKK